MALIKNSKPQSYAPKTCIVYACVCVPVYVGVCVTDCASPQIHANRHIIICFLTLANQQRHEDNNTSDSVWVLQPTIS